MTSPAAKKDESRLGRVVILATGGTIAGAACPSAAAGYRAGQVEVAALVAAVPSLQALADEGRLQAQQVAQVDSKDMGPAVWRDLLAALQGALARPDVAGVVVYDAADGGPRHWRASHRQWTGNAPDLVPARLVDTGQP